MRLALLCATRRGYLFLKRLRELAPAVNLVVFSFREEAWEPPFLDDIRNLAESTGCRFVEARNVASDRVRSVWDAEPVDLLFAVSWRYVVPAEVYGRASRGAFVFHDSLLPAYRGFAPTVWAIINGEDHTGVTLFEMAAETDAGDIVAQQRVPIGPDDTIAEVLERVTAGYLQLLENHLPTLMDGIAPRRRNEARRATHTCKRLPADNRIDWSAPTAQVYNLIRAVGAPYPGAFTQLDDQMLRIWAAKRLHPVPQYVGRVAGRVVEVRPGQGAVVLTGDGALLVTRVQPENGQAVVASTILNRIGQTLGLGRSYP